MEKIIFRNPQDGEEVEFYVVEQTKLNGTDYLLVTEEEAGDADAYLLKDMSADTEEEAVYEMVESEEELQAISRVFSEMLEDIDLTLEE